MNLETSSTLRGARFATFASLLSLSGGGCAAPAAKSAATREPPHVYRLDFVVATDDGREPPRKLAFTMNLAERQPGDVFVGKNVRLDATATPTGARTDVGLKLDAECNAEGDDVFVRVHLGVSEVGAEPSSIEKAIGSGDCLVRPGQSALALRLDDGQRRREVYVTPTLLR